MNLRKDRVVLPKGTILDEFHVVEYPDWVGVLAVTTDGNFILVEQYRHGIESINLELPAGRVDVGEDPAIAARRELVEETGYAPGSLSLICTCAQEPAKHSNYAHLYLATDCVHVAEPQLDAGEDLLVRLMPLGKLMECIDSQQMVHGIHIMAVSQALARNMIESGTKKVESGDNKSQ